MNNTLSSAYPAGDILAFVVILAGVLWSLYTFFQEHYQARHRHNYARWEEVFPEDLISYSEADAALTMKMYQQHRLRSLKEQDAKDQETLDRATEYRNGISS